MKRAMLVLAILVLAPTLAFAVNVKGYEFPDQLTVEGEKMQFIGAGVRNKWFFDVYVLSAYSQEKQCDPQKLVDADQPKMLRIDMLRDVSAERMASTIGGSFAEHMPKDASEKLKEQRRTFEGYFKDEMTKGTTLELVYKPGVGTIVKQAGEQLGPPLEGHDFVKVLWDIYFGEDSCCGGTKKDILEICKTGG